MPRYIVYFRKYLGKDSSVNTELNPERNTSQKQQK